MASLPALREVVRKARGAFFTPPPIAEYLARWAIRSCEDRVLEPSCGEAAFLLPAGVRLQDLGRRREFDKLLNGVDIHAESIQSAAERLTASGFSANLKAQDFFELEPEPIYDAVIGNPPYVRYQSFAGATRIRSLEAALKQGVRLNQLASSWAAFTVHASAFLKSEGRLALVLPAELLSVSYASQIRRFLLNRFSSVRLVVFEELLFDGVLADVVLLLAEGTGGAPSFEVFQARDASALETISNAGWTDFTPTEGAKWTGALMPSDALRTYEGLLSEYKLEKLQDWGEPFLGSVTGNNKFFALSQTQYSHLGLKPNDVVKISPPGSRHLHGLAFTCAGWELLAKEDEPCFLLSPRGEPSTAASSYILEGEVRGANAPYKCNSRKPWWRPSAGIIPDLIFTYMSHECPRILRNEAQANILNSVYGITLRPERAELGRQLLPLASLNSVTLLGAEILGRAYGGGLLKLEPTEVSKLPVPSHFDLQKIGPDLKLLEPQIGALLRRNEISKIVKIVDRVLLCGDLGIPKEEVDAIAEARLVLFERRATRGRSNAKYR